MFSKIKVLREKGYSLLMCDYSDDNEIRQFKKGNQIVELNGSSIFIKNTDGELIKEISDITKVDIFYCQSEIEGNDMCETQCDHCNEYYEPVENCL